MDHGLKCKMQNYKLVEKDVGKILWDLRSSEEFLDFNSMMQKRKKNLTNETSSKFKTFAL